jgi:ABC-type molybdate transport system ATPase subunit
VSGLTSGWPVCLVWPPDAQPIVAEVTADASTELQLVPGTELFLLIKTTAVTLYEDPSNA